MNRIRGSRCALTAALAVAAVAVLSSAPLSDAAYVATATRVGDSWGTDTMVAPSPVSCTWTGTNALTLTWTNTTAWAEGYDYERSNSSGAGFSVLGSTLGAASITGADGNPAPPTLRYYRVRSTYGANWRSPYSAEVVSNGCAKTITTVISGTTNQPSGVAVDTSENVYTSDQLNHRILRTTPGGSTTVYAGNGLSGYTGDGGAATSARLNSPRQIAFDSSGNLYITDTGNHVIRRVTSGGTISTYAGNGLSGYTGDGGAATSARLSSPLGVAVDGSGVLFIADSSNDVIRRVTAGGTISTYAGNGVAGYTGDGGAATSARLDNPFSAVPDGSGNLFIADTNNNVIRRVSAGGTITTVVGGGANTSCTYSGTATGVSLLQPKRLAYDTANARLFIPDADRDCIRVLSGTTITQVAGTGTAGYSGDNGPAVAALMDAPVALAYSSAGNLYVTESLNNATRRILQP